MMHPLARDPQTGVHKAELALPNLHSNKCRQRKFMRKSYFASVFTKKRIPIDTVSLNEIKFDVCVCDVPKPPQCCRTHPSPVLIQPGHSLVFIVAGCYLGLSPFTCPGCLT